jgi:hypothetical protein
MSFTPGEIKTVLAGDEKAKAYWQLKLKLQRLTQVDSKKIQSIYIMVPTVIGNIWEVVADNEFKNPSQVAHLHEKYDISRYTEMKKALLMPTADKETNSDSFGTWFSGYAPILNEQGKPFAVIGLDMRAGDVEALKQQVFNVALFYILIGAIAALMLARLTAGAITSPIIAVVDAVKKVKNRKFSTVVHIKRNDEIGELIDAFNEMAQKLNELDKIKSDFLSVVSHELYTPLTPIRVGVEQLRTISQQSPDYNKIINVIENQALRLQELIDEILDFSWLEIEEWRLNKEPISISLVAEEAIKLVEPEISKKAIKLNYAVAPDLNTILADKKRLLHVIKNLLDNAIKFNHEQGEVSLKISPLPDGVEVRVKDNGIGIARENLDKIFTSFYQAEYYMNRTHGGVGLGLSIAKRIIEAHRGIIRAESEGLGKGSTIIFTLPIE